MSYRLADGSCSTDYKIGDEFTHKHRYSAIFTRDDGEWAINWCFLTPVKAKKHANTINQLRKTIKQLKATIQELER